MFSRVFSGSLELLCDYHVQTNHLSPSSYANILITHYHEPWGLSNEITTWCFFPGNSHADQAVWLQPWQCHWELPVEVSLQKESCNKTHFGEHTFCAFLKTFRSSLWKLLMECLHVRIKSSCKALFPVVSVLQHVGFEMQQ